MKSKQRLDVSRREVRLHCCVDAGRQYAPGRIPIRADESNYTPLAQTVPASERQEAVRQAASSTASTVDRLMQALPRRC